jgi:hypothetical protein
MTPKQFCEKYLENYTINPDYTIDVNGNVDLYNRLGNMKKLPVKFGKVSGYFYCSMNKLTTLEGCPKHVGGVFNCFGNRLTTLDGCPKYIGSFSCGKLTHHILGNVRYNIGYFNNQRIVI